MSTFDNRRERSDCPGISATRIGAGAAHDADAVAGPSERRSTALTPIVDIADAAFVMSLDCQFLAWGSRAQQLFGFSPPDVLGRYCYDVLPARDASGQCLCSLNWPMVVAARYGYSVPPSEACICTKQNRAIWLRLSPIVLRAPHGAICAILVVTTDVRSLQAYRTARTLDRKPPRCG